MNDLKKSNEYLDFLNSDEFAPAKEINNRIVEYVRADLYVDMPMLFAKLLLIHGFVGILTMLFCPQFNLSLTNNFELFHYFHYNFGEQICMVLCGSIFVGSGALFSSYLLKLKEIEKIRNSRFIYSIFISSLTITVFLLLGAEIYLRLTLFWFVGATLSAAIFFEMNHFVRSKFILKFYN